MHWSDLILFAAAPLPLVALFGAKSMDAGSPLLNIILIISIIVIFILCIIVHKNLSPAVFCIILFLFAFSLLLMNSARSGHVVGEDIRTEFFYFQQTLENGWDPADTHPYNWSLSTNILPSILYFITRMDPVWVYKVLMQLIFAISAPTVSLIARFFLSDMESFLASFLFIAQWTFIYEMPRHIRQEIALLLFALFILAYMHGNIVLMVLFALLIVVSHYTTAFMFAVFLALLCMSRILSHNRIKLSFVILVCSFILLYLGVLSNILYHDSIRSAFSAIDFSKDKVMDIYKKPGASIAGPVINKESASTQSNPYRDRLSELNKVKRIVKIAGLLTRLLIIIGFIYVLCRFFINKESSFMLIATSIFFLFLLVMLASPLLQKHYGITRLYQQSLVILAPLFVFGAKPLRRFSVPLLSIILILQLITNSGLIYAMYDVDYPIAFSNSGFDYDRIYIHDAELDAAQWVSEQKIARIYANSWARGILILKGLDDAQELAGIDSLPPDSIVFLRERNREFIDIGETIYSVPISQTIFPNMLADENKVYDNGAAQVYYS
ncbi:DUF2206 domain-containing protein [Candidatus Woesearchaeota archaeon]|nr:DUF2206 domain-containing protein [Candidatus Woesearchaeota archaeon]